VYLSLSIPYNIQLIIYYIIIIINNKQQQATTTTQWNKVFHGIEEPVCLVNRNLTLNLGNGGFPEFFVFVKGCFDPIRFFNVDILGVSGFGPAVTVVKPLMMCGLGLQSFFRNLTDSQVPQAPT
jgi:hypothetical protein